MHISSSKNFLFIHVPKTAGSSMSKLLKPHSIPSNRRLTRRFISHLPFKEDIQHAYFRQHSKGTTFQSKINSDVFTNLHKFAVVRNPYDHMVSYFGFHKKHTGGRLYKEAQSWSLGDCISYFEEKNKRFASNQSSWLTDADGAFLVDRILFFEHLEKDFADLANYLDLGEEAKLPRINTTKRTDYRDYYDSDLKRRVENLYAPDFDNFGYEFDTPFPTKCPVNGLSSD
jgi:hypothetical protein